MLNKKNLNKYVLSIIDIKEDELKKTLLLQLNIFILISTLLIVKPTINSLFLSELSADALPIGYVLTAFFAIIGFYEMSRRLEKILIHLGHMFSTFLSLLLCPKLRCLRYVAWAISALNRHRAITVLVALCRPAASIDS